MTIYNNSEGLPDKQNVFFGSSIPRNAASVTPSDAVDLSTVGILYVTGGGDVAVDLATSGTVTYTIPDNTFWPVQVKKVYATGTTATGIILHW